MLTAPGHQARKLNFLLILVLLLPNLQESAIAFGVGTMYYKI
jgi:hypothetical protein